MRLKYWSDMAEREINAPASVSDTAPGAAAATDAVAGNEINTASGVIEGAGKNATSASGKNTDDVAAAEAGTIINENPAGDTTVQVTSGPEKDVQVTTGSETDAQVTTGSETTAQVTSGQETTDSVGTVEKHKSRLPRPIAFILASLFCIVTLTGITLLTIVVTVIAAALFVSSLIMILLGLFAGIVAVRNITQAPIISIELLGMVFAVIALGLIFMLASLKCFSGLLVKTAGLYPKAVRFAKSI